ncbi:MAG: protein kinase domain-containing protein, partial [Dehalococcoidales bacterium]
PCIVKQVRESISSESHQKKLEAEALSMAVLNHPNIAMIFDHFVEDKYYFLVVERISGKTLSEVFKERHGQFSEREVLNWAIAICDVVSYLHSKGVIHRDISPDNIMLTEDNKVKFIDFGASHEFRYSGAVGTVGIGKYGYTPPEQWRGKPEQRSDIFALGATIYYLLTGFLPLSQSFTKGQAPQKEDYNPEFPPIRTRNPNVSARLEAVLQKALKLDIEQRFSSAAEFCQALKSVGVGRERKPAPPPREKKARQPKPARSSKKKLALIWVAAGTVVALLLIFIIPTLMNDFTPNGGTTTPPITPTGVVTALTTSPANGSVTSTTTPPILIGEYIKISFAPTTLSKSDITGSETFNVFLSGNFTCINDIAYTVSGLIIVPKVTARNANLGTEVTLIAGNNITADYIPLSQGQTASFMQTLTLRFPDGAADGSYYVYLNAEKIKVNVGYWVDINELFQLREQFLGMVTYSRQTTANYITGNVWDATTNAPIADATIDVYEIATNSVNISYYLHRTTNHSTDTGSYQTDVLSISSTYIIQVSALGYGTQWFDNVLDKTQATRITISNPGELRTINFRLTKNGSISGKILGEMTPWMGNLATVFVLDAATKTIVTSKAISIYGDYSITELPPGNYYVEVTAGTNNNFIVYYKNTASVATATLVKVNPGQNTPDINFYLLPGSISGKVIAEVNGQPIENIQVYASEYFSGRWIADAYTSSDGTYTITNLPAGTYRVGTWPASRQKLFVQKFYNNTYDSTAAQQIKVDLGQIVNGIDFSLATGGMISGTVRDANGVNPLSGIVVECFDNKGGYSNTTTDNGGNYTIYGAPLGQIYVRARGNTSNYVLEFYQEKTRQSEATLVNVGTGISPTNIDFTLDMGGTITGTVISQTTKQPIPYIHLDIFDYDTGEWVNATDTGTNGNYTLTGLATGRYRVWINISIHQNPYVAVYYNNTTDLNKATPVSVTAGQITSNINFSLAPASTGLSAQRVLSKAVNTSVPISPLSVIAMVADLPGCKRV